MTAGSSKAYRLLPEGFRNTFRSLRYRNYRLFFGGQSLSLVGTWIQRIAMPWLVYSLTDSVVLLGIVGFASQIPAFLLTSFAGVLADRWNRYRLLIITQVLAMVQALVLALLYYLDVLEVWHIIGLSIMLGCINAFDIPTRQSFVVEMVDDRKDLGNAIALNSSMVHAARLIGPSVAGIIITIANEGMCFLVNGLSFLLVILSLLRMRIKPRTREKSSKRVMHELKEGFVYTFSHAPIKSVILLLALVSLTGMPYTVLMPVFAREILHGGPHTYGFLMGASGLGAFSGAIFLASRRSAPGLGKLLTVAAGIFGTGLVLFSFSHVISLSLLMMVVIGLGMMLQMASSNTILQTLVDDDKRGRVMSFYAMAFMGMTPFGSLLAGSLADVFGAPVTLAAGGILCVAGAIFFARRLSGVEKMLGAISAR